jgi:arylsulfatase A-like enzyme
MSTARSNMPVCVPSRFALITGVFAMSCGAAQYIQARAHLPAELTTYVQELWAGGYYCRKQWA